MSSAASSTTTLQEADPLPRKVGELGYVPPMSPKSAEISTNVSDDTSMRIPPRHPADREGNGLTDTPAAAGTPPTSNSSPSASPGNANTSGSSGTGKKRWSLGGISPLTLLRLILLTLFLTGTIVAWVITVTKFVRPDTLQLDTNPSTSDDDSSDGGNGNNNNNGNNGMPVYTSMVIVHVSFTVVVLVELLFLERAVWHARAERYLFKHGMPRSRNRNANRRNNADPRIGIAPWNRPPLPTYAAALAESGVGTGDVEDNLIAIAPPPAYGNTRGSVLLLSGHLRESLVRALRRNSQSSQSSSHSSESSGHETGTENRSEVTPREMEQGGNSRPISYDASEEVDNARRARELEDALARLDRTHSRSAV